MEPDPSPIPPQEKAMIEKILSQILSLPLNPNQQKVAESFVSKAVYDFSNNERAAFLSAKNSLCGLTPEELKEFEQYSFFPEEHPRELKFIRERREVTVKIGEKVHKVEIVNRAGSIKLDEEHIEIIKGTLERVARLTPEVVGELRKIFIIEEPESENAEYGANGSVTKRQCDKYFTGIVLKQRGYRTDISHRIAGVSNLEGTIVHELGHIICSLYRDFSIEWMKTLKYHRVEDNSGNIAEGWVKLYYPEKDEIEYLHLETGIKSKIGLVPADLSKLPSQYAGFYPPEDICESFVAWVFGKPLDEERKRLFEEIFGK
jgi:hypothetical protein